MDWTTFHAYIGTHGTDITWWQMTIRAVLIFLFGLALLRTAGRRVFNKAAPVDIFLAVLIGSNLSRALTANAPFISTLAATAALVALYWVLTLIAYRFKWFGWLLKGRAVLLVRDGVVDWKNMRRHGFSEGDLAESIRSYGMRNVEDVAAAYMERNGSVTVIPKK